MDIELKTGLTACNQCKNEIKNEGCWLPSECLAYPRKKFSWSNGEEYICGYKSCAIMNKGDCKYFEQKPPEEQKETWFKNYLNWWDGFINRNK